MNRLIIVFVSVLFTGCGLVKPYTQYNEEFSEMHISADASKVIVIGSNDYFYIFDASKEFSEVLSSSLRKKFRAANFHSTIAYPQNIEINAMGEVISMFTIVADVDGLGLDQLSEALRIGFSRGKRYLDHQYVDGRIVKDGDRFPRRIGEDEEAARKAAVYLGDVLFLPVRIKGSRYLKANSKIIQEYKPEPLSKKYQLIVIDHRQKSVDPKEAGLMVFATGAGVAGCIAIAPLCFVTAIPMAGLKP